MFLSKKISDRLAGNGLLDIALISSKVVATLRVDC